MELATQLQRQVINLRSHEKRGGLIKRVSTAGGWPRLQPVKIVLVHGYNVDQPAAKKGYEAFFERLRSVGAPAHFTDNLTELYWPGNKNWGKASFLSYSLNAWNVNHAALKFSEFLTTHFSNNPDTQLVFIAHSLGCRMILECLNNIISHNKNLIPKFRHITLMAAAVPASMLKNPGDHLYAIRNIKIPFYGFHSKADRVLLAAFPVGQALAFQNAFSQAVGRNGEPAGLWKHGRHFPMTIDHGDYWSNEEVAQFIAYKFGLSVYRILFTNTLPVNNYDGPRQNMIRHLLAISRTIGQQAFIDE